MRQTESPRRRVRQIAAFVLLVITTGNAHVFAADASSFRALLDEEWEYELRTNPETATIYGDRRFNAQLSDYSPAFHQRDLERKRQLVAQFESIAANSLSIDDQLNRELILRRLRTQMDENLAKTWEMPVDQMNGIHLMLAQLPSNTTFSSAADYRDYLSRLHQIPRALREVEAVLRLGMRDRLVPPRYLLEKALAQVEDLANAAGNKNPFARPIQNFPAQVPAGERKRFSEAINQAIADEVSPAFKQLASFLRETYVPAGRSQPGIWSVPNGDAYYRQEIRVMTTTDLTPEEFHSIGLRQVEEITGEMMAVARKLGFHDLSSLNRAIAANRSLYAQSGDQILGIYSRHIDEMRTKMPQLFGRQPKAPLVVTPMEAFRAANAVPADYSPGSADGSRPGRINVNEYNPTGRLRLNMEAIAYHEGIPGHHQQIALAQELAGLPEFRRHADYNAFTEGWALYSERLGKEVGLYRDPYSDYGRLQNEMWRAVRLVVDTGVHAKHWSREQMVNFFRAHTAMDDTNIQTEVDRYIAWPAQALGYKAGQIKILTLRDRARQALGNRFDLRAFHDAVLGQGALPLDVLEEQINRWIEAQKKGGGETIASTRSK